MERASRLPRFFVLWSTLIWAMALFCETRLAGAFVPPQGGLSDLSALALALATLLSMACAFISRVLIAAIPVAVLGILLRHRMPFGQWLRYAMAGALISAFIGVLLSNGLTIAYAVALVLAGGDRSSASELFLILLPRVVGEAGFGFVLGAKQSAGLSAAGYSGTGRLVVASATGWGVSAMVAHAYIFPGNLSLVMAGALITVASFIPGLVTGLALKRIVEAQDAPSEDVGGAPVPTTDGDDGRIVGEFREV
ncbi:MAG: hypothetical protein AB7G21_06485 [Dehalococcoidia bacterium]